MSFAEKRAEEQRSQLVYKLDRLVLREGEINKNLEEYKKCNGDYCKQRIGEYQTELQEIYLKQVPLREEIREITARLSEGICDGRECEGCGSRR